METSVLLRIVYAANETGMYVAGTSYFSSELGIPKSTAHKLLVKLAEQGYGVYIPRKGFVLNNKGLKEAKKAMRKHRLIECLLEEIGVTEICLEAARIESVVEGELLEVIEKRYGSRKRCPCGKLIP